MALPSTLSALGGQPIRTMMWDSGYAVFGPAVWASPGNSPYSSGAQFMPFDSATPSTGDSPTLYNYAGVRDVPALDGDACIIGASISGANVHHRVVFYDLLWVGPIISGVITAQTIGSGTLPARDNLGGTNGEGCMLIAWNSGGNPTISATYTNSAGVGSRTATFATTTNGGPWVLSLAAGDTGVKSVQDITTSTTGAVRCAIVRRLAVAQRSENATATGNAPTGQRPTSRFHNLGLVKSGALIFPQISLQGNNAALARNIVLELAML